MNSLIQFAILRSSAAAARAWRVARQESGAIQIEFAFCAIVLFTIMFGIMAFSLVMYCDLMTSNAARQGARYASVRGNSWSSDCTAAGNANCIAQQADIQSFAQNVVAVNSNNLKITTTWLSSTGVSCGTDDSCKSPGSQVKVTAKYSYKAIFPLVPTQNYTMTSTAVMTVIQ
jgi:Flp pilus assembly protein TadG